VVDGNLFAATDMYDRAVGGIARRQAALLGTSAI
jgi:hypothetical protein